MADDLTCQAVETVFDSAHAEHGMRVEKHMLEILGACIEGGADGMTQQFVDIILQNLIEPRRSERPAAYDLTRKLIANSVDILKGPLFAFLQGCLPTTISSTDDNMAKESELKEDWPELLIELTDITHEMVQYVLPQLVGVAKMEDESIRLKATELLSKLLLLENTDGTLQRQAHASPLPASLPPLPHTHASCPSLSLSLYQSRRSSPSSSMSDSSAASTTSRQTSAFQPSNRRRPSSSRSLSSPPISSRPSRSARSIRTRRSARR